MHNHIYKRKQLICALIVAVFMMVTVFEPITAVAAEMSSQETQTQEQQQTLPKDQSQLENQNQKESTEPESLQKEDLQQVDPELFHVYDSELEKDRSGG